MTVLSGATVLKSCLMYLERVAPCDTGASVSLEGLSPMETMGVLGRESPPGNEGVRAERGQTMKLEQKS